MRWLLLACLALTGCANVQVKVNCRQTAPQLTNVRTHPVCGLH